MSDVSQYVTFGVAEELFAAPVARVREILEIRSISRLPRAPAEFLGMIDLRGQGIPVVDLRSLLSMPATDDTFATRIIVLVAQVSGQMTTVGLKTDRVLEVTPLDEGALEQAPDFGDIGKDGSIVGIGRRNGAFVTVLDLDELFAVVRVPEPAAGTLQSECAA